MSQDKTHLPKLFGLCSGRAGPKHAAFNVIGNFTTTARCGYLAQPWSENIISSSTTTVISLFKHTMLFTDVLKETTLYLHVHPEGAGICKL